MSLLLLKVNTNNYFPSQTSIPQIKADEQSQTIISISNEQLEWLRGYSESRQRQNINSHIGKPPI